MKKMNLFGFIFIIIVCSFLNSNEANAQIVKDSISIEKGFWSNSYIIAGQEYSESQVVDILKRNYNTEPFISSYYTKKVWGYITMTSGAVLTWYVVYAGVMYSSSYSSFSFSTLIIPAVCAIGLDIAGITLFSECGRSLKKAIKTHNKNLLTSNDKLDLRFGLNGISLTINF